MAYVERKNGIGNIFIYDIEKLGTPRQLTFGLGHCDYPVWSPKGKCVLFYSGPAASGDPTRLYWTRINESGLVNELTTISPAQFPSSWSQDGSRLAVAESTSRGNADIRIVHLAGDDTSGWRYLYTSNYLATPFDESNPSFSPDGNWLAYTSLVEDAETERTLRQVVVFENFFDYLREHVPPAGSN